MSGRRGKRPESSAPGKEYKVFSRTNVWSKTPVESGASACARQARGENLTCDGGAEAWGRGDFRKKNEGRSQMLGKGDGRKERHFLRGAATWGVRL